MNYISIYYAGDVFIVIFITLVYDTRASHSIMINNTIHADMFASGFNQLNKNVTQTKVNFCYILKKTEKIFSLDVEGRCRHCIIYGLCTTFYMINIHIPIQQKHNIQWEPYTHTYLFMYLYIHIYTHI